MLITPFEIDFLMRPKLRDESDKMFIDLTFASKLFASLSLFLERLTI